MKEERIKVRKRIRRFYFGMQSLLHAAGCYGKDYNVKFDDKEQREAERLWKKLDDTFTETITLLTQNIVRDRGEV